MGKKRFALPNFHPPVSKASREVANLTDYMYLCSLLYLVRHTLSIKKSVYRIGNFPNLLFLTANIEACIINPRRDPAFCNYEICDNYSTT